MKNSNGISRRKFLKWAGAVTAIGAGGFALKGILSSLLEKTEEVNFPEEWRYTTCWIGKQDCGIRARIIDGNRIVQLEGEPNHPRNRGKLCPKGQAQIISIYDPYRVKAPLIRINEKGVPGKFREASWDEALELVADQIKKVREKNPKLILWQKGRSKAKPFYDKAFVPALGATSLGHGAYCSDAGYRACEYTIGLHGVLHPDFRHTRYLFSWGWNATNAGGNKFCWITWNRQFLEARRRGMRVVSLNPTLHHTGPHADEWIPIKPGTDLAFFLAIAHELVKNGFLDKTYLTNYTNAPFLVQEDGFFLRIDKKEQVWDTISNSPNPYDAPGISPALEGEFTAHGQKVKTAFQLYKEHIEKYSPEWASPICEVPAETIRRIAKEMGENALIGSKILIDGIELPYRPVAIMGYHVTQQELGFQASRAALHVMMLLGAIEAVGGQRIDFTWKKDKHFDKFDKIEIKDPPDYLLKESKYFPITTANPSVVAHVMLEPAKYGVKELPEICILHMANPIVSFADIPKLKEAYKKFKFVVDISPWLSETADLFADVILPCATMEKYEGPIKATDQYEDAVTLRIPPIPPLFQSKGEIEIYLDLCEKIGVLGDYLGNINKELKLKDPYKLDLNTKPTVREIFDRWAKSEGIEEGVKFFETKGVKIKGPVKASKYYGYAQKPPFEGIRHRLYGEALLRYQKQMKEKGVPQIYWQDYTPFPTWRPLTMEKSPPDYDLYLISTKKIEHKQSRTSFIPLLAEIAPEQRLIMNSKTAKAKGIRDGDEVWVESHNAVTGETRKLKVKVTLSEAIRPDTVNMPHHYGMWTHPWTKGQGPTPNELFFSGEGYVLNTCDQSFQVKVKVYKE